MRKRPRIGLDLHVADGIYQGSRTHCLELFSRVVAATPECDFVVLVAEPERLVNFSRHFTCSNVTLVAMPPRAAAVRLLWELPHLARQYRMDLLHTQYVAPPYLTCASAVTVHDVLFESHPEYFERLFVLRSRLLVSRSVRGSDSVFTVSNFSRRQISQTYSTGLDKIHVIPNAVDKARFYPGPEGSEAVKNLGLEPGRYFLTVGRLEPRKNHANLLRAWASLGRARPRLAIVGQRHFHYGEAMNLICELHLEEDVVILEAVPDAQLPAVYRNAKAFIYCSWAEGFGLPVLEAMASGIPVICSATTALSEVCAGAACLVSPGSVDEIGRAIRELDQSADVRRALVQRGLDRARDFSWDDSAALVREVYLEHFGL